MHIKLYLDGKIHIFKALVISSLLYHDLLKKNNYAQMENDAINIFIGKEMETTPLWSLM